MNAVSQALFMDDDRRWLEHLLETVEHAIEERRKAGEHHRRLVEDLEQLRQHLAAKLRDAR